jgi:hypothetical protein
MWEGFNSGDMSESEVDTSRTAVQTYVPAYQRDEWDVHAEELGMNRSEFIRTMVQAGRRGFGGDPTELDDGANGAGDTSGGSDGAGPSSNSSELTLPGSEPLAKQILDTLEESGPHDWDALVDDIVGDIETRLDETVQDLSDENRIRYSGPDGGYVLVEDE